jgi:hypothetical protein
MLLLRISGFTRLLVRLALVVLAIPVRAGGAFRGGQ